MRETIKKEKIRMRKKEWIPSERMNKREMIRMMMNESTRVSCKHLQWSWSGWRTIINITFPNIYNQARENQQQNCKNQTPSRNQKVKIQKELTRWSSRGG